MCGRIPEDSASVGDNIAMFYGGDVFFVEAGRLAYAAGSLASVEERVAVSSQH